MAVKEGNIQVGNTDKLLDTTVVEQTDGADAHREAVFVGDPEDLVARARVLESPESGRYAAMVTDENSRTIIGVLELILERLERIEMNTQSMAE